MLLFYQIAAKCTLQSDLEEDRCHSLARWLIDGKRNYILFFFYTENRGNLTPHPSISVEKESFTHHGLLCPGRCRQDEGEPHTSHQGTGMSEERWGEWGSQNQLQTKQKKKKGGGKKTMVKTCEMSKPIIYMSPSECHQQFSEFWIAYKKR